MERLSASMGLGARRWGMGGVLGVGRGRRGRRGGSRGMVGEVVLVDKVNRYL